MMFTFLLGLILYVLAALAFKGLGRKWPVVVEELQEWSLPTVTVLLIIGLWML